MQKWNLPLGKHILEFSNEFCGYMTSRALMYKPRECMKVDFQIDRAHPNTSVHLYHGLGRMFDLTFDI